MDELETLLDQVEKQQAGTRHLAATAEIDAATARDQRRADAELLRTLVAGQQAQGRVLRALVAGQKAVLNHFGVEPPATKA